MPVPPSWPRPCCWPAAAARRCPRRLPRRPRRPRATACCASAPSSPLSRPAGRVRRRADGRRQRGGARAQHGRRGSGCSGRGREPGWRRRRDRRGGIRRPGRQGRRCRHRPLVVGGRGPAPPARGDGGGASGVAVGERDRADGRVAADGSSAPSRRPSRRARCSPGSWPTTGPRRSPSSAAATMPRPASRRASADGLASRRGRARGRRAARRRRVRRRPGGRRGGRRRRSHRRRPRRGRAGDRRRRIGHPRTRRRARRGRLRRRAASGSRDATSPTRPPSAQGRSRALTPSPTGSRPIRRSPPGSCSRIPAPARCATRLRRTTPRSWPRWRPPSPATTVAHRSPACCLRPRPAASRAPRSESASTCSPREPDIDYVGVTGAGRPGRERRSRGARLRRVLLWGGQHRDVRRMGRRVAFRGACNDCEALPACNRFESYSGHYLASVEPGVGPTDAAVL